MVTDVLAPLLVKNGNLLLLLLLEALSSTSNTSMIDGKILCWTMNNTIAYFVLKSEQKKPDTSKSWPLIKNPQFLSNPHET